MSTAIKRILQQSPDIHRYIGHTHFGERAIPRRRFITNAAGAVGLALGAAGRRSRFRCLRPGRSMTRTWLESRRSASPADAQIGALAALEGCRDRRLDPRPLYPRGSLVPE
jgi:hypothetical protein